MRKILAQVEIYIRFEENILFMKQRIFLLCENYAVIPSLWVHLHVTDDDSEWKMIFFSLGNNISLF